MDSPKYGRPLTTAQFKIITNEIMEFHRFGISGRMIKYIHPTFDTRDSSIFHVIFRGLLDPIEGKEFDFRDNEIDMFDNIMCWLKECKKH